MIKSVPKFQIRKGMYIQELQGAWINHPFWRKSFLLDDDKTLRQLKAADIDGVIIDTSKGLDVLEDTQVQMASLEPPIVVEPLASKPVSAEAPVHVSFAEERENAVKLLKESKRAVTSMFEEARMGKAVNAEAAMPLVNEIALSVSRNENALISLVRLKNKDDYTYMHSVAVCALMVALAKELKMSEEDIRVAGLAGLVHDIGKIAIPNDVLNKPGALTDDEFKTVKLHPVRGHEILLKSSGVSAVALDVCLHHHEKVDGTGYPHKLKDKEISLFAKMGAVCDVYDAITSNRPYKDGWEPGISLQRMAKWRNTHFDNKVFEAFVKSVGIYPVGSTVLMQSGRLGVVVDQGSESLLTPVVKLFFSTKSKTRIPIELIDLSQTNVQDAIVKHEDPVMWGIQDVSDLWVQ